jgi:hypothetical protein
MNERRLQINPQPLQTTDFYCPAGCQRMHREDCKYYLGGWFREANEDRRVGTWYYYESRQRWELELRSGDDDYGWYLFGPDGSPFGLHLHRRLGPAKLMAEDWIKDYPGARDTLRGGQRDERYADRLVEYERKS